MTSLGVKPLKMTDRTKNVGRNPLPFNDYESNLDYLYKIGKKDPPIKVKDFIQLIRRDWTKKRMSYEYKILGRLCPVYHFKKQAKIFQKINPYRYYYNAPTDRHLVTKAFVKLVLDENTGDENDLTWSLRDIFQNTRQDYGITTTTTATSNKLFLKEARLKQRVDRDALIEKKKYYLRRDIQAIINSRKIKDLGLCLTFRGLLAYLYSLVEYRKHIENKGDRREAEEKDKERVKKGRISLLKESTDKIHRVIRNPNVIKEAPFLEHSELLEGEGFDVVGLLLRISIELIDQLHFDANNDLYLLKRATERYLVEFDRFFSDLRADSLKGPVRKRFLINIAISGGIPNRLDEEPDSIAERVAKRISVIATLNEYRKRMSWLMRTWTFSEMKEIDNTLIKSLEIERALKKAHKSSDN